MGRERDTEGMGRKHDRGRKREGAYLTDSRKLGLKKRRACFTENRRVKQARKNKTNFFLVFR